MFKDLNVIIGITGGIAAYKAGGIVSYLKSEGANLDVIMTKNACEFITPLTLETLSGNKVITDMFERPDYIDVRHISLARKADLFLIVPATANIIGKVANDLATIRNEEHIGYIIDKNNEVEEAHGKEDIAKKIVRRINYGK